MRKFLSLFLAIIMLIALTACNKKATQGEVNSNTSSNVSSTSTSSEISSSEINSSSKEEVSSNTNVSSETENNGYTPLLYKIYKGQRYVWVFGSIHIGTDKMRTEFPKYITGALASSTYLAVECDIIAFEKDENAQISALENLVYTDGTTISDYIDSDIYNSAVSILTKEEYYNMYLDYYFPVFWANTIDSLAAMQHEYKSENGIDSYLLEYVKKRGKEIIEIESAEEQYEMMASFSPELQELLLASSIANYNSKSSKETTKELVDAWCKGDEKKLTKLLNTSPTNLTSQEKKLYDEYNSAMITTRNKTMVRFVEEALLEGDRAFICVGAAHVLGDDGIVATMQRKGYRVELYK